MVGVEVRVELHAGLALAVGDGALELLPGNAAADGGEHLHEAPVRVPREALVAGACGQTLDRSPAQAEVQHRVHHPRHRLARARSHRHEQRVLRVPEALAGQLLEASERVGDLLVEAVRLLPSRLHVRDARLGRDREARGDALRPEHTGHLRDPGSLPAEQLAHVARALGEVVDELGLLRCPQGGARF